MRQRIFILSLITILFSLPTGAQSVEARLKTLDSTLAVKNTFVTAKREHIAQLRQKLHAAHTLYRQYDALYALYEEYQSFQYDSASLYARRAIQVARQLDDRDLLLQAGCAQAFCLVSAGLYQEAHEAMAALHLDGATPETLAIYYRLMARYYFALSDYVLEEPYTTRYLNAGDSACAKLLPLLKPRSAEWWYITAQRLMKARRYPQSLAAFQHVMDSPNVDDHTKAIAASCMGFICGISHQPDQAIDYLARSAIYDLRTATTETTALRNVAQLLYRQGDIDRATAYIHQSMDDANFYNARQRKIEVGSVLPIIEQSRYQMVTQQRRLLMGAVILISLFLIAAVVAIVIILRQSRKLREAQAIIAGRNQQLQQANAQLQATNRQLNEANEIKDEYIGMAFYSSAESIKKTEKLYQSIERRIAARQFSLISESLKASTLNDERRDMYRNFDTTFLKLFPNFVADYNAFFPEADRHVPEEGTLTTEMRIFALIRLGITQSERIAVFLNYSVNTINTYKTRVKNRALVDNDKFEAAIMNLSFGGKVDKTDL